MADNHKTTGNGDAHHKPVNGGVSDHHVYVALAGNPNSGKTTLFNALTGGRARTGNYAGVTVEKKEGRLRSAAGRTVRIIDLPGLYSLSAASPEEEVAQQVLLGMRDDTCSIDVAIVVVDASNLERNLYLAVQVAETGVPTIIALNMIDVARKRGIEINSRELSHELGMPVVETVSVTGEGVDELRELLDHLYTFGSPPRRWRMDHQAEHVIGEVAQELIEAGAARYCNSDWIARRALFSDRLLASTLTAEVNGLRQHIATHRQSVDKNDDDLLDEEVTSRYRWIRKVCEETVRRPGEERGTRSEAIDRLVLHPYAGPVIFFLLMAVIFQAIFSWSQIPVSAIESGIDSLCTFIEGAMAPGELRSLLVDGIIAGVGNVLVFLPQIALLFFFIAMLEDTGYMARAAFLMDKVMGSVGLNGHAFIPLLSSFACAVPGILATRTIANRRDRMVTILIAPLMACSARLPVYMLLIAAFFPEHLLFGFISLHGAILFSLYFGGIAVALTAAGLLRLTLLKGERSPLLLEMPSYKIPRLRNIVFSLWQNSWAFVKRAGSVILVITIIVWYLLSHPVNNGLAEELRAAGKPEMQVQETLVRSSYMGQIGFALEPAIRPLGYDWKIGVGLISAMAAREVIIGTMAIIYNAQYPEIKQVDLKQAMLADRDPATGKKVWTPLVAASLLTFFVFACMCTSTLIVIYKESGSIWWVLLVIAYTFALAYVAALAVYQGGAALGFS